MKKKGDAVMSSGINQVLQGDCIETMEKLSDQDIDSIVTDPPYGLAFMGKDWDSFKPKEFQEFSQRWGEQAIRVLKPGGYLLAFSGTRTYHRMVTGLEDAGFIIKDQIDWLYGQGFPKSHNIKKSLMDLLDDEGKVVGKEEVDVGIQSGSMHAGRDSEIQEREVKKPTDERIKNLKLTGTALKPAHEPIVLAQKPYENRGLKNVDYDAPLQEAGITAKQVIRELKAANLYPPIYKLLEKWGVRKPRSGCFLCPKAPEKWFEMLYHEFPFYFEKVRMFAERDDTKLFKPNRSFEDIEKEIAGKTRLTEHGF